MRGRFLVVGRVDHGRGVAHQVGHHGVGRRENERLEFHGSEQDMAAHGHIAGVDRLAVHTDAADEVQRLGGGHAGLQVDVVWCHQTTDRVLGIGEEASGEVAFVGREKAEEFARHPRGEFLEECRTVVGGHLLDDATHVFLVQTGQKRLLVVERHLLEHVGGQRSR